MADNKTAGPRSASELVEQKLKTLGKGAAVPAAEPPPEPAPQAEAGLPSGNELDVLRSIMFGSLQRDVDRRLREMNQSIDALSEMVTERTDELQHDVDARLTVAQKETSERAERQSSEQSAAIAALRKEVTERMEQQFADLRAQFKALATDTLQRQDALRAEIMGLLKAVEDSKVSRAALGDMLLEMGQRLKK